MATINLGGEDIEIKVVVDATGAVKILKATGEELDVVGESAEKAGQKVKKVEGGFTSFQAKLVAVDAALGLLSRGFNLVGGTAQKAMRQLEEGYKAETIARGFDTLYASIGRVSSEALAELRRETQGLINDTDLQQRANQAIIAGLNDGTGAYEKATGSVVKLAESMGVGATDAIDRFNMALMTGRTITLRSIGLNVDAAAAYLAYAEANKEATESTKDFVASMTDEEKKLAVMEAAFSAASEGAAKLGDAQTTAGKASQQLGTQYENLISDIQVALSGNELLAESLINLSVAFRSVDTQSLADALAAIIGISAEVVASITNIATTLEQFSHGTIGLVNRAIQSQKSEWTAYTGMIKEVNRLIEVDTPRAAQNAMDLYAVTVASITKHSRGMTLALSKDLNEAYKKVNELGIKYGLIEKPIQKAGNALTNLDRKLTQSGRNADEAAKKAEELARMYEELGEKIDRLTGADGFNRYTDQILEIMQAHQNGTLDAKQYKDALEKLRETTIGNKDAMKDFGDALPEAARGFDQMNREADKLADEGLKKLEEQTRKSQDAFAGWLNLAGLPSEFSKLGGEILTDMFGADSAIAAFAGGPWAMVAKYAIDGINAGFEASDKLENDDPFRASGVRKANAFHEGFWKGILGDDIGGLFAKYQKKSIDNIINFGNLPGLINQALGGEKIDVIDTIAKATGWFGSSEEGSVFRKGVTKFFKDAIKESFPEGILLGLDEGAKRIKSLSTEKYAGDLFGGDVFDTLSDDVKSQFLGIGDAFAVMFDGGKGDLTKYGSQLANIFANSVENLNNLQMMLQATGIGAEELLASLEKAYLDGNLSAHDFVRTSQDVEDLYAQGIPGSLGDANAAFQNFITGGLLSGRHALDGLGDMAAETFKKLGDNATLEDLRNELVAAGNSAEEVDKLFQAFSDNGIKTLEELRDVGVDATAGIVNSLQSFSFAFDEPTEKVENLHQKLREIDGMDPEVKIKVTADISPDARAAMNLGKGGGGGSTETIIDDPETEAAYGSNIYSGVLNRLRSSVNVRGDFRNNRDRNRARREAQNNIVSEFVDDMQRLIESTQDYRTILADLEVGTISQAEAALQLRNLYDDAAPLLDEYQRAERRYQKALREGMADKNPEKFQRILERYLSLLGQLDDFKGDPVTPGGGGDNKTPQQKIAEAIDAFKNGAASLSATLDIINANNAISGGGLAGFADMAGAWNQLLTGSGADLIAGLKNLGVEGQEGGFSLGSMLNSLGGGDNAKAFREALKRAGIDDISELSRLSDVDALEVLATLKELGVPLSDAAMSASRLSEAVADIPEEKTIYVHVITDVNGTITDDIGATILGDIQGGAVEGPGLGKRKRKKRRNR
jgi:hypothetical protein